MGPSVTKHDNTEVELINHPYFGNTPIVTHDKQKYMKLRMLVDSQRTVELWDKSQKIVDGIDPDCLLLAADHQMETQGMCGTASILNILYENYPIILRDEISNRRETDQFFEEKEIWYLLHILIYSASEFHRKEKKLGDIRPDNIFINQDGQVKLANICSWPREENNYLKSLNDKEETYLAPEELIELERNKANPETDPLKAESFSIGLSLLDVVQLADCSTLYNFRSSTFDSKKLEQLLGKMEAEKTYSSFLREIIKSLLHPDPKLRSSTQQAYNRIKPYEYNIKNLIEFRPEHSPLNNYTQYQEEEPQTGSKVAFDSIRKPVETYNYSSSLPRYQLAPLYPSVTHNYSPSLNTSNQSAPMYTPNQRYELPGQFSTNNPVSTYSVPRTIPEIYQNPNITSTIMQPVTIRAEQVGTYSPSSGLNGVPKYQTEHMSVEPNERVNYASGGYRPISNLEEARNVNSIVPPSMAVGVDKQNAWQQIDKQIERSKMLYK